MNYPPLARACLGNAGFAVQITGRRCQVLLSICDRLFDAKQHDSGTSVRVGESSLHLNLANPSERLLYYAPYNLLHFYRRSPLFFIMEQLAGSPGLFVDIGANLGLYSLLARHLGYQTLLFEPEPVHYAFLSRNADVIGTPIDCALSDRPGTAEFFISDQSNPGSSSLVMPHTGGRPAPEKHAISVRLSTFDSILVERGLDPASIRLIKIDVEGNEERTVLGMRGYLARATSAPVWCEVRGPSSGRCRNSVAAVTQVFAEYGYQPFSFKNRKLVPYQVGRDSAPQVFDLLYAVPARHGEVLQLSS